MKAYTNIWVSPGLFTVKIEQRKNRTFIWYPGMMDPWIIPEGTGMDLSFQTINKDREPRKVEAAIVYENL